jgi:hypothetical protein
MIILALMLEQLVLFNIGLLLQMDMFFYNAGSEKMRIDNNVSTAGYIFAGGTTTGLRINGNDYGNTIYQDAAAIGVQPANICLL